MAEPASPVEPPAPWRSRRVLLGDPGEQRASLLKMTIVVAVFMAPIFSLILCIAAGLPWFCMLLFWLAIVLVMLGSLARSLEPPEVTVGIDGLSIRAWGRTSFLPIDRIERVRGTAERVEVRLRGGGKRLVMGRYPLSVDRVRELVGYVEQAARARADTPRRGAELSCLERGGRSIAAWRDELAGKSRSAAVYRVSSISPDEVAAVLVSPGVSAEHRIGAALALSAAGATTRIRVASQACASPQVRAALEAIAEGALDEAALEEALDMAPSLTMLQRR